MTKRNPVARALRSPALRVKKVAPKKGRGSYSRKRPATRDVSSCSWPGRYGTGLRRRWEHLARAQQATAETLPTIPYLKYAKVRHHAYSNSLPVPEGHARLHLLTALLRVCIPTQGRRP